jgi:hypothetical protein
LAAAFCAANAAVAAGAASGAAVSSAFAFEGEEAAVSSVFLCALFAFDFAGLFAKPADTSNKTSVNSAPHRKIDRIIPPNLRYQIWIHTNQEEKYPNAGSARTNLFFGANRDRPSPPLIRTDAKPQTAAII